MAPGPDIAPYHDRQVAILDRSQLPARTLLKPIPVGSLAVNQVG